MNAAVMKKFSWAGGLTGLLAAAAILFACDPSHVPIYPMCIFHRVTGLDCPGCGSLRALHALLHGDLATALRFNAFVVLSLPLLAWIGGVFCWRQLHEQPPPKLRPLWLWTYLGAFLAFGILRDLPVPFLRLFAP